MSFIKNLLKKLRQGRYGTIINRKSNVSKGVIGCSTRASTQKVKRSIVAILKYLTMIYDDILETYPAGKLPPIKKIHLYDLIPKKKFSS